MVYLVPIEVNISWYVGCQIWGVVKFWGGLQIGVSYDPVTTWNACLRPPYKPWESIEIKVWWVGWGGISRYRGGWCVCGWGVVIGGHWEVMLVWIAEVSCVLVVFGKSRTCWDYFFIFFYCS